VQAGEAQQGTQLTRAQERREALAQADPVWRVLEGQDVVVAPERRLAQGQVARPHVLGGPLQVVAGEEGTAALAQAATAVAGIGALAARAVETEECHGGLRRNYRRLDLHH